MDPYLFGGREEDVLRIQEPLARYFGQGDVVADLGCGRGTFLELLRERGATGIGIDTSAEALEACRQKGFSRLVQKDALDFLATDEGALDGIVASHLIEHLVANQALLLVQRAHAALRPGGTFVVVTPNPRDIGVMNETFWLDPTHVRPYPLPLLREWFMASRFEIVAAHTSSGVPLWAYGRRHVFRNLIMKLLLGGFYWAANSVVVGRKA